MTHHSVRPAVCPIHGRPTRRQTCQECNAAYMRGYMRTARRRRPTRALLDRAKQRAQAKAAPYSITAADICVPALCPVLGHPLVVGGPRSDASPSLDRVDPASGYEPDNVRVISDRANRMKGGRTLSQIRHLSRSGRPSQRSDYHLIAAYMEREALLLEVKRRARTQGAGNPWIRIGEFLEQKFRNFRPIKK